MAPNPKLPQCVGVLAPGGKTLRQVNSTVNYTIVKFPLDVSLMEFGHRKKIWQSLKVLWRCHGAAVSDRLLAAMHFAQHLKNVPF